MILVAILILGCRSKDKLKYSQKVETKEFKAVDSTAVIQKVDSVIVKQKKDIFIDKKLQENDGDIIIKGKSDSINDFHYHNVINGDTLSDIYISGNADFIIKNRWKKAEEKVIEKSETSNLNIIAQVARAVVSKETIKNAAETIKGNETQISSKGFGFPVYLIIGIVLLVAVVLFIVIKQFKK